MPAARDPEQDLAYLLSRTAHQVTRQLSTILDEEGLSLGQWWVLQLLSDGTSHGMSDAADYAMLPAPSLTKAVDQLVSAKLIDRRADPQDRRRVLIHLTARGRRRRQQLADRLHPVTTLGAVLDGADVASLSLDPPIHEWGRCFLTQAGCRGVPAVAVVTAGRRMWLVRAACWWLRGRVIPSPP